MKNSIKKEIYCYEGEHNYAKSYSMDDDRVDCKVAIVVNSIADILYDDHVKRSLYKKLNLTSQDIVVNLDYFFPNVLKKTNKNKPLVDLILDREKEMRKWRWERMLQEIEKDMKEKGQKILLCFTTSDSMICFLKKNWFKHLDEFNLVKEI